MAERLFRFNRRQMAQFELETSMEYTIKNFTVCGLNCEEQELLREKCLDRIGCICKAVCIRENISKSGLDNRKKTANKIVNNLGLITFYKSRGFISPTQLNSDTSGKRGIVKHEKVVHEYYKEAFKRLFDDGQKEITDKYYVEASGWLHRVQHENVPFLVGLFTISHLPLSKRSSQLSPTEFCQVILNEMSTKWARKLLKLPREQLVHDDMEQLRRDVLNGYKALAGRWATEMMKTNNLFDAKEFQTWSEHIKVIISLSVYLTVLDSVFHETRKCCYDYLYFETEKASLKQNADGS